MRAILVVCCVVLAWPVQAASVSFTDGRTYFQSIDSWSLPKFDPSLGTLTGVSMDVLHSIRGSRTTSLSNPTDQPQAFNFSNKVEVFCCEALIDASTEFPAVSYASSAGVQTAPGQFIVGPGGFDITSSFAGTISWSDVPGPREFDFYIATTLDTLIGIDAGAVETISLDNPAVLGVLGFGLVGVETSTTINYEFTPVSEVPILAAMPLLLSALAVLGLLARSSARSRS